MWGLGSTKGGVRPDVIRKTHHEAQIYVGDFVRTDAPFMRGSYSCTRQLRILHH